MLHSYVVSLISLSLAFCHLNSSTQEHFPMPNKRFWLHPSTALGAHPTLGQIPDFETLLGFFFSVKHNLMDSKGWGGGCSCPQGMSEGVPGSLVPLKMQGKVWEQLLSSALSHEDLQQPVKVGEQ